jgi:hypothetical protein
MKIKTNHYDGFGKDLEAYLDARPEKELYSRASALARKENISIAAALAELTGKATAPGSSKIEPFANTPTTTGQAMKTSYSEG